MRWKKNTNQVKKIQIKKKQQKRSKVRSKTDPHPIFFSKADKLDTSLVEINHLGLSDAGPVMSKTPHLSSQDVFVERLSCGT